MRVMKSGYRGGDWDVRRLTRTDHCSFRPRIPGFDNVTKPRRLPSGSADLVLTTDRAPNHVMPIRYSGMTAKSG